MESLPEECQYLTADEHSPETDPDITCLLLEALYLVIVRSGREGRDLVKAQGTYPVVRELHLRFENQEVREKCEKIANVLMVDEVEEASTTRQGQIPKVSEVGGGGNVVGEVLEDDEENEITPIF